MHTIEKFLENLKRKDPCKGSVDFKLYPWQRDFLRKTDQDEIIIKKDRQIGASTILMGYAMYRAHIVWDSLYPNVLCVSHSYEGAKGLKEIERYFSSQRGTVGNDNITYLSCKSFPDSVKVKGPYSLIICDEMDFWKTPIDIEALRKQLEPTGQLIIASSVREDGQESIFDILKPDLYATLKGEQNGY